MPSLDAIATQVKAIEGVRQAWFEVELGDGDPKRVLVVCLAEGLDPFAEGFDTSILYDIEDIVGSYGSDPVRLKARVVPNWPYR